jgi:small GTP-binding protein
MRAGPTPFKVVLLGGVGVGKTSLLHRFTTDEFAADLYHTIGQTYVKKVVEAGGEQVLLHLWDTPGQEQFAADSALILREAHCCIACYDLHEPASYECVAAVLARYEAACVVDGRFAVVAGNKSDLVPPDRQAAELERLGAAQRELGPLWAQSFLTSARRGECVAELFHFVAARLVETGVRAVSRAAVDIGRADDRARPGGRCC